MRPCVTMLVVVGVFVAAAHADDKDKIQGTWKALTVSRGTETKDDDRDHRLVLQDGNFSIKQGEQVVFKGTYKIDSGKDPKTIDLTITDGEKKDQVSVGIYKLEGDKLTWASSEPGVETRPNEFTTKEGSAHMVVEFKREK